MERRVPVRELNQRTSAVLNEVAGGSAVTITSGGRPVARLVPITSRPSSTMERLVRAGRATAPASVVEITMPPDGFAMGVDVAENLAADRNDERW